MIDVYITTPAIGKRLAGTTYVRAYNDKITRAGRWAEAGKCRGTLIFTDHYSLDPWTVAQHLIERTEKLIPLVAAQPPYLHPFAVARIISSLVLMYGRQIDVNLVTGGNREHLAAVGSVIDHDDRYRRLVEYAQAIGMLLESSDPVDLDGAYYQLSSAYVYPPLRPEMFPRFFLGGSSDAARETARTLGITRLQYPRALESYPPGATDLKGTGVRVGIIARDTSAEAWKVAEERFPRSTTGEVRSRMIAPIIDSTWWHQLQADRLSAQIPDSTYWLYPLRGYGEFCPYLVGDHQAVAEYFAHYLDMGISTLILQLPRDEADVHNAMLAVERAERLRLPGNGSGQSPAHP